MMSAPLLLSVKEFRDDELVLDEEETRLVLKFFWPQAGAENIVVSTDARRLAQSMLVAAIDGSYAMGFVHALWESSAKPGAGIKKIAQKFAKSALQHHFRHARIKDLEDVEVYETIRRDLAWQMRLRFDMVRNGMPISQNMPMIYTKGTVAA